MLKSIDYPGHEETGNILTVRKINPSLLAALLVLVHFIFLMAYFEPAISTPDANGYFAQAKLIAGEHRTYFETESDIQFVGAHWHSTGDNRYFSKYPPGFPAVLAVVYRIFGPGDAPMGFPVAGPARDRMARIQKFRSMGRNRRRPGDVMFRRFDSLLDGEPLLLIEWKM